VGGAGGNGAGSDQQRGFWHAVSRALPGRASGLWQRSGCTCRFRGCGDAWLGLALETIRVEEDGFFTQRRPFAPDTLLVLDFVEFVYAAVALKATGERMVIEIKREINDVSFDSLARNYAGQTTDYKNVSIRLGSCSSLI
jgi:hypothetical protein